MNFFHIGTQAYTLSSPYFSPVRGNWQRIGSLAGLIFMTVLRVKYDGVMNGHIHAAFDFFQEKKPLEKFNGVFRSAVFHGCAAITGVEMVNEFLRQRLALSFQNAMISDTLQRWLQEGNYRGLKTVDCHTSQKTPTLLAVRIPNFTSTTLTLALVRTEELAVNLLSLYRIYHLSKPLVLKSAQFPLNCQGGIFAILVTLLGLFSWIKVRAQESITKSHTILDKQRFEVLNRITFLERNALQVASIHPDYKDNILNKIQLKATGALASVSSVVVNSFFNEKFTFMFPRAFELTVVYLASLFAKADPEHFDYTNSFLPLLRESVAFMWRSTYFIQGILNDLLEYHRSIKEIREFSAKISLYEKQKEALAPKITKGNQFSIQTLTAKIKTDEGDRTLCSELSLKTEPGHLYFVRGMNGSGKTVLLKTIAGFHPFERGHITVPAHVWYLQPTVEIDPASTTFGEILGKTFGIEEPKKVEQVKTYLQKFRLYYSQDQWIIPQIQTGERNWSELSYGQKQILNLAVLLAMMESVQDSWLILADEILSHVDDIAPPSGLSTRKIAIDLLKQLAKGSLYNTPHTILIVDQNDSGMQHDGEGEVNTTQDARFNIYKQ